MDKNLEFDRRISEIHGFAPEKSEWVHDGGTDMDIRHEEFRAMTDTFLGPNYDPEKLQQVEALQIELQQEQSRLLLMYERGTITPEAYVDVFNSCADWHFQKCEEILGQHDFAELFGAPASEHLWRLDTEMFLEAQSQTGHSAHPSPDVNPSHRPH
jgi:hypothetical protein